MLVTAVIAFGFILHVSLFILVEQNLTLELHFKNLITPFPINYEPVIGDFQNRSIFPDYLKKSWRIEAIMKNLMEDNTMIVPPPKNQIYEGPVLFPTTFDEFGDIFARLNRTENEE